MSGPRIPVQKTAVEPSAATGEADTLPTAQPVLELRTCPVCARQTEARACPDDTTPTFLVGEPPTGEMPAVGAIVLGRYRLDRWLGAGAMGAVYAATDLSLSRVVAVELVRPDRATELRVLQRFYREAQALVRVSHAHIVPLLDFGVDEASRAPLTVLRLIDGPSLGRYLQVHGVVDEVRACQWLAAIAAALEHTHAQGLIHRDLKPDNVLLEGETCEPRLTDFGLVRLEDAEPMTRTGVRLGTPTYMAPEMVMGERAGIYSDLYALGCLIDTLLTGRPPFVNADKWEVMAAHASAVPPELPALLIDGRAPSAGLRALRAELLSKSPRDRPASAREVADRLGVLARASSVRTPVSLGRAPEREERDGSDGGAVSDGDRTPQVSHGPTAPGLRASSAAGLRAGLGVALLLLLLMTATAIVVVWSPQPAAVTSGAVAADPHASERAVSPAPPSARPGAHDPGAYAADGGQKDVPSAPARVEPSVRPGIPRPRASPVAGPPSSAPTSASPSPSRSPVMTLW